MTTEVIFVGLPGPTHHYAGLSADNVAASRNRGSESRPKQAALQALELARLLGSLGVTAAILPPQLRPHLPLLRQRFTGEDDAVIRRAAKEAPELLEQASSSSAMWTANAATVAPMVDTADGRLHITAANLFTHPHRRLEAKDTRRVLAALFGSVPDCGVHPPLPASLRDEGAANHMRLSPGHGEKGLHVFVYGGGQGRQDRAASQAVKIRHGIPDAQALFVPQNPDIIRAGVFHNDVIAVSNENVLLAHEGAYAENGLEHIAKAYAALHPGKTLIPVIIAKDQLSVEEAVQTYFFNSQIVTKPNGAMALIAPTEAQALYGGKAAKLMEQIRADAANPIDEVRYIDLRQSMKNGGGPACLRLRVPMTGTQLGAVRANVNVLADDALLTALARCIEKYYPDTLSPEGLGDPALYHNCEALLAELSQVMKLPLLA